MHVQRHERDEREPYVAPRTPPREDLFNKKKPSIFAIPRARVRRVSRSCVAFVSSEAAVRRALGRARVGGTEAMLSARYRRAVAQALAALQQAAEASAPVIDLCGSQEADAAADIEGADPDDEVGEHFSARQVGAWIRTHEKDELADRWDWYERVQRALNGLVRDGRVHMGELGRFRLADAGRVTVRLTLRWDEREEMPIEVSSSCTDARLREIVSKKTGGRLPASKMRLVYPAGFDAEKRELGELPDDTVLALQIVKRATRRRDAAARGPPRDPRFGIRTRTPRPSTRWSSTRLRARRAGTTAATGGSTSSRRRRRGRRRARAAKKQARRTRMGDATADAETFRPKPVRRRGGPVATFRRARTKTKTKRRRVTRNTRRVPVPRRSSTPTPPTSSARSTRLRRSFRPWRRRAPASPATTRWTRTATRSAAPGGSPGRSRRMARARNENARARSARETATGVGVSWT